MLHTMKTKKITAKYTGTTKLGDITKFCENIHGQILRRTQNSQWGMEYQRNMDNYMPENMV
jgi:hypothetical protein